MNDKREQTVLSLTEDKTLRKEKEIAATQWASSYTQERAEAKVVNLRTYDSYSSKID